MTSPASRLLFVYGTLRGAHEPNHRLARQRFVGEATVRGRLFDLGRYPGMTTAEEQGSVSGELYEIVTDWNEEIDRLDQYEGCSAHDPEPHEYRRTLVKVSLSDGETAEAWCYVLNRDAAGLRVIESGDWRAR
jgi:gamma-glutamylcyclotransferase (GGCT)/AIG2-like uncharacterized protein YtfP